MSKKNNDDDIMKIVEGWVNDINNSQKDVTYTAFIITGKNKGKLIKPKNEKNK